MTAQTFENATGSIFAAPARAGQLRQVADGLRTLSVQVGLDPHLAADIGRRSYDVPVVPYGLAHALRDAWVDSRALAGEQGDAMEIERCARAYDAPVLAASWAQAIGGFTMPGWLRRGLDMLRCAFESDPMENMNRHLARDIGMELETMSVRVLRQGGF